MDSQADEHTVSNMGRKSCPRHGGCCVQLCPKDPSSLAHGRWFPDEEICSIQQSGGTPRFVQIQKLIKKRTGGRFEAGFFTHAMLLVVDIVRPGIVGVDPDSFDQKERIAAWVSSHRRRPKKQLSSEEKARLSERGRATLSAWRKSRAGGLENTAMTKEAREVKNAAGTLESRRP